MNSRLKKEKSTVERMIRLYCRKKEGHEQLCPDCRQLLLYAHQRLDRCPYGDNKTSCKKCKKHCYAPAYRSRIRGVMQFSGPRMLLYHPLAALRHLLER